MSDILEEEIQPKYLFEGNECILEFDGRVATVKEATKLGYKRAATGSIINVSNPKSKTRRGRVSHNAANTLLTSREQIVIQGGCMRWLTERESWRLQGIPDEYFDRAEKVTSSNQLYKQAGNGLTVDIARFIGERMGYETE
ncbi:DNA methyltransferase [Bacillus wiedmannii]|uniref:DNA methyltransferase n=1 Tax=Bacillus wiedmannii TaxID=1890302 RepID=A0A2A8BSN9_9BACI|nr:DNA methyltransferase [Bacillus wiedmannii]